MNWSKIRRIKPVRTIRATIDGIVNVFKWLPIIWRDRDWDYGYFDDIILFKLKQIKNFTSVAKNQRTPLSITAWFFSWR